MAYETPQEFFYWEIGIVGGSILLIAIGAIIVDLYEWFQRRRRRP